MGTASADDWERKRPFCRTRLRFIVGMSHAGPHEQGRQPFVLQATTTPSRRLLLDRDGTASAVREAKIEIFDPEAHPRPDHDSRPSAPWTTLPIRTAGLPGELPGYRASSARAGLLPARRESYNM